MQPVDQRALILVANNQYKLQLRQTQRFNAALEVSNRTILPNQVATQFAQQNTYFQGGYPT